MPDITVFKMEIDDSTFNAPFGGRSRSDGAQKADGDEASGLNVKLVAGLGIVFLLTGAVLAFILKRRFGGNDDDGNNNDSEKADRQSEDENEREKGGIRAIIGLSFLVVSAAVVKGKIRAGSETTSRTIHRGHSP